jgi:hypothetical protein
LVFAPFSPRPVVLPDLLAPVSSSAAVEPDFVVLAPVAELPLRGEAPVADCSVVDVPPRLVAAPERSDEVDELLDAVAEGLAEVLDERLAVALAEAAGLAPVAACVVADGLAFVAGDAVALAEALALGDAVTLGDAVALGVAEA